MAKNEVSNAEIKTVDTENIYHALSLLQSELKPVERSVEVTVKTKTGGQYKFKYAPLDKIMSMLYPLMGKYGLSIRHEITPAGIECILSHKSKEEIRSGVIQVARTGDMKDIGGQITYVRRYTVTMLFGIASDEDQEEADLTIPDQKLSPKEAAQNLDVSEQMQKLGTAKDLLELRRIWTGFTVAQRENITLENEKNRIKEALEAEKEAEPVINLEEDNEVPPDDEA